MVREIKICERLSSSVDKTLSILECISQHAKGLSLAEVVRLVGIPKTTAHRILEILLAREYVIWHNDSEQYSIGIKTLEIGLSGLIGQDIVEVSIPYLRELSEKIGETSFLAVFNNGEIVFLYKAEGTRSIQTTARLGSRYPAYCTALGKAMLANMPIEDASQVLERKLHKFTEKTVTDRTKLFEELALIRANDYAVDDEGMEPGLYCIGVPIHNYTGRVIAAISISGPKRRMNENHEAIVSELTQAGDLISKRLGYVPLMKKYQQSR